MILLKYKCIKYKVVFVEKNPVIMLVRVFKYASMNKHLLLIYFKTLCMFSNETIECVVSRFIEHTKYTRKMYHNFYHFLQRLNTETSYTVYLNMCILKHTLENAKNSLPSVFY